MIATLYIGDDLRAVYRVPTSDPIEAEEIVLKHARDLVWVSAEGADYEPPTGFDIEEIE